MLKNRIIKPVIFFYSMLLLIESFGQCNARFVLEFGDGRVFSSRTSGLFDVTNCKEVLEKTYEPNFVFDSNYSIDEIINRERVFYLNENCKKYKAQPDFEDCIASLVSDNDQNRLDAIRKLICFYDNNDSIFLVIRNQFPKIQNEITKARIAQYLSFSGNPDAIVVLSEAANDSCEYVRLEIGRSLAWLGEKTISYNILMQIWQMQILSINLDKFPYFTTSMRNIRTPEAIEFLDTHSIDANLYFALDASICLLQLRKIEEGLMGIKYVLKTDDPVLFKSATRAINAYFPKEVLFQLVSNYKNSDIKEISQFVNCILDAVDIKN
jgi:hypothetical protein